MARAKHAEIGTASCSLKKNSTMMGVFAGYQIGRPVISRHDLSHQLVISRTNSQSFLGGAGYLTYWVSILAWDGCLSGMHFFFSGPGPPRPGGN